ncbi:cytochrome (ubi)quinol oxidase subunit III [Swaminathania salitolerans]|uniref:Cytochrome bo(3) ubiquinol oxidase subunit 3 n=1 Tax=Swaminathania salitolerans TaxID=182838 RepID=A0A511BRH4_9PROT|nr:cytochrome (ubi)quinol oxidase subunit III [Swaminathania salitolerans]GBQ14086.1 cytochrome o ubiquinol oxidase subunit III [Swaminathania salitolerans LMG 21291]GEL02910.1 cytochrome o ubiquinol oxidase subunit III [Swaminathania salitolerans]
MAYTVEGKGPSHIGIRMSNDAPPSHKEEARAQAEEALFGFWVFLMSDLIIFSMLFATYATMTHALAGGPGPKQLFDIHSAALETIALLLSSFTCGLATLYMRYDGSVKKTLLWFVVTLLLGAVFLSLELHDFIAMAAKGGVPSRSGWLSASWALIGTHGLHVTTGCIWLLIMFAQVAKFGLDPLVQTRFMRLALFWHFLDVVWIGIFSIVYLLGVIS